MKKYEITFLCRIEWFIYGQKIPLKFIRTEARLSNLIGNLSDLGSDHQVIRKKEEKKRLALNSKEVVIL